VTAKGLHKAVHAVHEWHAQLIADAADRAHAAAEAERVREQQGEQSTS
jgi:hypothetical protein